MKTVNQDANCVLAKPTNNAPSAESTLTTPATSTTNIPLILNASWTAQSAGTNKTLPTLARSATNHADLVDSMPLTVQTAETLLESSTTISTTAALLDVPTATSAKIPTTLVCFVTNTALNASQRTNSPAHLADHTMVLSITWFSAQPPALTSVPTASTRTRHLTYA